MMKTIFTKIIPLTLILTFFVGCGEPKPNLSDKKTHTSGALSFKYPENWKVSDEGGQGDVKYIIIESPGNVIVIIQTYSQDYNPDLTQYAKNFSKNAAKKTSIAKTSNSKFASIPEEAGFQFVSEDVDVVLLNESIPHRRLYGTKILGDRRVFMISQASTEDVSKVQPAFDLIRDSLSSVDGSK